MKSYFLVGRLENIVRCEITLGKFRGKSFVGKILISFFPAKHVSLIAVSNIRNRKTFDQQEFQYSELKFQHFTLFLKAKKINFQAQKIFRRSKKLRKFHV